LRSERAATGGGSEVVAAIPARWGSTRLPGKPLLALAGKPMVQHVYERAARAAGISRVVVLTDDERIAAAVAAFGGDCELTPASCRSGTDRIAWAARAWEAAAIVNVQGDEPLVEPGAISCLALHLLAHPQDGMATLAVPAAAEDLANPHAVKVVLDREGYALYFSRAGIPYPRHDEGAAPLRHLGLYGYRRETLLRLAELAPSPLEQRESLEQLRALENGIRLRVLRVESAAPGVDTAEDAERVERLLR
jgi:3-deoxy-manno-octulosonate cytidylyltransferase (CMP-KDO synthetase)